MSKKIEVSGIRARSWEMAHTLIDEISDMFMFMCIANIL